MCVCVRDLALLMYRHKNTKKNPVLFPRMATTAAVFEGIHKRHDTNIERVMCTTLSRADKEHHI